jgi:hypothetical protein
MFVLIVVTFIATGNGGGPVVTMQDFETLHACETAKTTVANMLDQYAKYGPHPKLECVAKGG